MTPTPLLEELRRYRLAKAAQTAQLSTMKDRDAAAFVALNVKYDG